MDIRHAILGLLLREPLTGYDIKKVMQSSPLMHWSGNNNQIYRALAELHTEGLVASEILHEGATPTKKRYTLTPQGRAALAGLSRAFPELPEIRKPFMMQLSFGETLTRQEMEALLSQYEGEVRGAALALERQARPSPDSAFGAALERLTQENLRQFYENEFLWIEKVRQEALPLADERTRRMEKGADKMEYTAVHKDGQTYVTVTGGQIASERDGIALVSACAEHGTNLLMLPAACLSDDFLRLSTRVAGEVLQKLVNYNIKAAAVFDAGQTGPRFREFLLETNRGQAFRVYPNMEDAEKWLLEGNEP
ncbi:MAG TPA: DUF4180 domain-containing protein [Clostridia bacterium]|nr:DUF4180 domain-containing protein [Clostridia bacterium]